jgi:hypothetical protein
MVDFRSIAPSKGERGENLTDQTGPSSYRRNYIVMGWGRLNGDQLCSRNVVGRKKGSEIIRFVLITLGGEKKERNFC